LERAPSPKKRLPASSSALSRSSVVRERRRWSLERAVALSHSHALQERVLGQPPLVDLVRGDSVRGTWRDACNDANAGAGWPPFRRAADVLSSAADVAAVEADREGLWVAICSSQSVGRPPRQVEQVPERLKRADAEMVLSSVARPGGKLRAPKVPDGFAAAVERVEHRHLRSVRGSP
jgi:DNA-binding transcriptional LysR family regulator